MLIICNGTFKSGSSWFHEIVINILKIKNISIKEIPIIYNLNQASPTRILEKKLNIFLANENYNSKNYVTKAHYFSSKTFKKNYD